MLPLSGEAQPLTFVCILYVPVILKGLRCIVPSKLIDPIGRNWGSVRSRLVAEPFIALLFTFTEARDDGKHGGTAILSEKQPILSMAGRVDPSTEETTVPSHSPSMALSLPQIGKPLDVEPPSQETSKTTKESAKMSPRYLNPLSSSINRDGRSMDG